MRKGQGLGILELLAIALLLVAALALAFAVIFGPELYARISAYLERERAPPPPPPPPENQDFRRYFELKNRSCGILSKDFLIVTGDSAQGYIKGLIDSPGQAEAAEFFLSRYEYNQTTKTYLKGTWMKRVIETGGGNLTTIWKDGTEYFCSPNCTMRRLGDAGWQAHLDSLERIRTGCAHFGRTKMPGSVNMSRLLTIERDGFATLRGNKCERFLISGNKTYADGLMNSGGLTPDQEAVLFALSHLSSPVEECLDEGTGIVISRSLTMDLTKTYKLDYSPGGYMRVTQKTGLTYYSNYVPDSFFALPG